MADPAAVLRAFADISDRGGSDGGGKTDVLAGSPSLVWQRYEALSLFTKSSGPLARMPERPGRNDARILERLEDRALAAMRVRNGGVTRIGWVWFSGRIERDGKKVQYCLPAVTREVELPGLVGAFGVKRLRAVGDVELTSLINDRDQQRRLLDGVQFGGGGIRDHYVTPQEASGAGGFSGAQFSAGYYEPFDRRTYEKMPKLKAWVAALGSSLGLPTDQLVLAHEGSPADTRTRDGITVHLGLGIYQADDGPGEWTRAASLERLAELDDLEDTALAHVYSDEPLPENPMGGVQSFRPLTQRQQSVASRVARARLAAVSGAPGTGKSHVLSVVALDAIARNESVLVVAGSSHAVDVLAEHFAAAPGPAPVVFGGARHGDDPSELLGSLVDRLAQTPAPSPEVIDEHTSKARSAMRLLAAETEIQRLRSDPARRLDLADARTRAGDLSELERCLEQAESRALFGWMARRRARRMLRERLAGPASPREEFERLTTGEDAMRLEAGGGLTLVNLLDGIVASEPAAADQLGRTLAHEWSERIGRSERSVIAKVAAALRANRARRSDMLAAIDPGDLMTASPLWVGSTRDVDDILPSVAGLFDLVIIDEAAQIDQLSAAATLARAKRAIVCGDPHQIGHSSFRSKAEAADAFARHGIDTTFIDPTSQSLFDAASARAPVVTLTEHFRSVPHLIEFSARRVYGEQIDIVTRTPANEAADHIHVQLVEGSRNAAKVNEAEVSAAIELAESLIESGERSIGFMSPFRAQVDALEEAILDRWRLEEIDAYGLRVGTVHGFQGDERDVVIASWAIGADEGDGPWRFVNQRNLFNVMVTRARDEMFVLTSTETPPGLAADYVRFSEPLTNLIDDAEISDGWVGRIADALAAQGIETRCGYRVGRHVVDLVIGPTSSPVAVDCRPHPDGPQAHIDRALQLRRAGWRTADAFESRWADRLGELVVELQGRIAA